MDFELDELKREFLVEAEEKVREIETAFAGTHDRAAIDRMSYLAHQLKGSGGSYGFQKISTHATDLEQALETWDGSEGRIGEHVRELKGEIEARLRELTAAK